MVVGAYPRRTTFVLVAIIGMILILGSAMFVLMKPASMAGLIPLGQDGISEGDYFDYDVTGTFNNMTVTGTYHIIMGSGLSWTVWKNMSDPSLNVTLNQDIPFDFFGSSNEVGTGKYATSYGVKDVVWLFKAGQKWVSICYSGTAPAVNYGCVVNGQNIHLDIVLKETSNQWAKTNNTSSLSLNPQLTPDTDQGGLGSVDRDGITSSPMFYTENGGVLQYFLNATDVDIFAHSDGNIRSMAEGGIYAYDPRLTGLHTGNMTGELVLPGGFYVIILVGHTDYGDQNNFDPNHSIAWTFTKY